MVKRLTEKEWKPIKIIDIFETVKPGKISRANQFEKVSNGGVNYIAATNRNNGVLYYLEPSEDLKKKVQAGNCIGFIKDGDGSAGYAIYKYEPFASTVNVLYGYADWLNRDNGLFFVAAQDKIEDKYSHGYKRNLQHLRGDKVMLPVDDKGEPDYAYMTLYSNGVRGGMLMRYKNFIAEQLSQLEYKDIPALEEKEWKECDLSTVYDFDLAKGDIQLKKSLPGRTPLVSAGFSDNGIVGFIETDTSSNVFSGNKLTIDMFGQPFYQPAPFQSVSHGRVNILSSKCISDEANMFIVSCIKAGTTSKYSYNQMCSQKRLQRQKVMLPVDNNGKPDYAYMEQYAKNMILRKYKQYLAFIDRQTVTGEV